jgi:hypothetical protein
VVNVRVPSIQRVFGEPQLGPRVSDGRGGDDVPSSRETHDVF